MFFAIWPDDPVRDALATAALDAREACGGRATAAPKIHLTLFFVGEIERARIPELEACASAVEATAFALDLDVLGYWRHNRIVWAGTRSAPPALVGLAAALTAKLAAAGYRGEDRLYVPHVTLVRNARQAPPTPALEAPAWGVREFVLVESAGGRYEPLSRWGLRPPV